jgi:hypothetical protein
MRRPLPDLFGRARFFARLEFDMKKTLLSIVVSVIAVLATAPAALAQDSVPQVADQPTAVQKKMKALSIARTAAKAKTALLEKKQARAALAEARAAADRTDTRADAESANQAVADADTALKKAIANRRRLKQALVDEQKEKLDEFASRVDGENALLLWENQARANARRAAARNAAKLQSPSQNNVAAQRRPLNYFKLPPEAGGGQLPASQPGQFKQLPAAPPRAPVNYSVLPADQNQAQPAAGAAKPLPPPPPPIARGPNYVQLPPEGGGGQLPATQAGQFTRLPPAINYSGLPSPPPPAIPLSKFNVANNLAAAARQVEAMGRKNRP